MAYEYDLAARRFRDTETGRFLAKEKAIELRDEFIGTQKAGVRALAADYAAEKITLAEWEKSVRAEIKRTFLTEALLGRGGQNAMTAADYGAVGRQVRTQYEFLRAFAKEVAEDGMSEARMAARSELYVAAARQAYERARAAAFGLKLPAYPGDGKTSCKTNCHCHWDLSEAETEFQARWVLGSAEHCEGCEENASKWNPLVVAKQK